jgi:hypothetical protein
MALKWLEGFEAPDTSATYYGRKYATGSGAGTNTGRVSGNSASMSSSSTWRTASLGSQKTWTIGFGFKGPTSLPASIDKSLRLYLGASEQFRLRIFCTTASVAQVDLMRGATVIATVTSTLSLSGWHYIELQVGVDTGTAGTIECRIDEVSLYTNTGTNTANAGVANADVVELKATSGASCFIDDWYICDDQTGDGLGNDTFRGDSQVVGFKPNANGSINQFTPSSGTNHATLLADSNDSSYVASSTVNQEDLVNFEDPTIPSGSIFGIQLTSLALLDVAGSRQFVAEYYDGASHELPTSHVVGSTSIAAFSDVVEANPVSATNWSSADLNAAQFGVKLKV